MIKGNHVKQQLPLSPTAALKRAMLDALSANEITSAGNASHAKSHAI
jgi:hypothetical protein